MKEETRPLVFGLLAWLCFALAVGVAGYFRNASAVGVTATVWILTAVTLLACWKISLLREGVNALDLRWLVALHLTRLVGIYFLVLGNRARLPLGFARPAGVGDIVIAAAAGIILLLPRRRILRFIVLIWNALGLIDIVFVAFSALRFGLRDWQSMAALRALPLSLVPTFLVPLIIASHVLIFVRLRSARARHREQK
jgi:hypothetical protein